MGVVTLALSIVLVGYVGYRLAHAWDEIRRFAQFLMAGATCGLAAVTAGMLAGKDPSFLAIMAAASALCFFLVVAAFSPSQPR